MVRGRRKHTGISITRRRDGRYQAAVPWTDSYGAKRRTFVYGSNPDEVASRVEQVRDRLKSSQPVTDSRTSLEAYAQAWIDSTLAASERKQTTKTLYAGLARTHIIGSTLGSRPLKSILPSHVERWVGDLKASGRAPSTVRQVYTVLRAILDTAVRDKLLAVNPAAAVKRPKVSRTEAEYLTAHQVRQLLQGAVNTRYGPLFAFLVNTGLRRGEALALRWSDVDLKRRTLHVRGTMARIDGELRHTSTKTLASRRVVPLSPAVVALLESVRARQRAERLAAGSEWVQTPYVFTTETGTPCDPRNALRALKASAKRAGLEEDVGLHTLRHSAASVMLEHGIPLKVVSELLGHSSVAITGDVYGHVTPEASYTALSVLSDALNE